jgi:PilZ domain
MRTDTASAEVPKGMLDRRRHARYRYSAPIAVHPSGGSAIPGISLEISESGMSALIGAALIVGDTVELEPVAGGRVAALVRRHTGKIYGFEFLNLTPAQIQQIADSCKSLPKYQCKTMDI